MFIGSTYIIKKKTLYSGFTVQQFYLILVVCNESPTSWGPCLDVNNKRFSKAVLGIKQYNSTVSH